MGGRGAPRRARRAHPGRGRRAEGRQLHPPGAGRGGPHRRGRRRRREGPRPRGGRPALRPHRARPDAAQGGRLRHPQGGARPARDHARARPHRARQRGRQGARPRPRRRRLPHQAVLVRRVPGPRARAAAPGRGGGAGAGRGRSHPRSVHAGGAARRPAHHAHRARARAAGVLHAQRRPRAHAAHAGRARVGARLRPREQHRGRLRRLPAPQDRRRRRGALAAHRARRRLRAPRGRPVRALSVHTRLTLWYAGALLAILVVISALSYSLLAWSLAQDVDRSLLTVAKVVRDASRDDPIDATEQWLRDLLDPEHQLIQLLDPNGTLRLRSRGLRGDRLPLSPAARQTIVEGRPAFETVVVRGQRVRVVALPVRRNGRLVEVVQVGASLRPTERTLGRWVEILAILVPLAVGLAAAGGRLMARTALKPVDDMSQAARRIDAEALGRRVAVRGTGDELDRLAETLNGMLGRLESTFTEIRRFSADAAHELRTPLTALKGTLEVALRADRSGPEYREALASALEEVDRLVRLSEDLLLLSRSTAGPESPAARVDLESLVLDVASVAPAWARTAASSCASAPPPPSLCKATPARPAPPAS